VLKLYHAPRTRSIRIIWLLEELGLPYALETVEFKPVPGKLFAQATPSGKVPVLVDGDITMAESGAMVEYIIERYGNGRLAPLPGTPERAAYLQWLHFSEATIFAPVAGVVWLTRYRNDADQHPDLVADAKARAAFAFEVVERGLQGRDYLLASGFSAADIMMGFSLLVGRLFGITDDARLPRLAAYRARLEARPAWQKALAS